MAGLTLQQILQQGYAAFERCHQLPDYVRRAAWAMLVYRTAVLGGHVQSCPDGHYQRIWYNSCRHRMCPQCAWVQVERWLARQKTRLLACEHYHVIFTMPDELRGLWLANVRPMTTVLFATVHETLAELLGDEKYLGACPGLIATLHTWSQTLVFHPHLHCLVTGGGLTDEGQWRPVRNGFLLPVRVVMAVFRGKLLAAIDTMVRGGPLSNHRLVSCAPGEVTFRYRINGEHADSSRQGLMTLSIAEFMRRYLLHVPEPGTKVVRCYGLYAPTKRAAWAVCRAHLGQGVVVQPPVLNWQAYCQDRGDVHPERCPVCGRRLVCLGVIPHSRVPPPVHVPWEVVA